MTERPIESEPTLDPAERDRFGRLASEWWDANGKFRTLHQIGPARLTFLRDQLLGHFGSGQGKACGLWNGSQFSTWVAAAVWCASLWRG